MKRFRGGLVFKAHRLVYHSTLGLRVIKKKDLHRDERVALEVVFRVILPVLVWVEPGGAKVRIY